MTLLETLIHIRDNGPSLTHAGICSSISLLIADESFYSIALRFEEISSRWGKYSGDRYYPVSGETLYREHGAARTLWAGEQLALRMDLINFAIKELQNEEI